MNDLQIRPLKYKAYAMAKLGIKFDAQNEVTFSSCGHYRPCAWCLLDSRVKEVVGPLMWKADLYYSMCFCHFIFFPPFFPCVLHECLSGCVKTSCWLEKKTGLLLFQPSNTFIFISAISRTAKIAEYCLLNWYSNWLELSGVQDFSLSSNYIPCILVKL